MDHIREALKLLREYMSEKEFERIYVRILWKRVLELHPAATMLTKRELLSLKKNFSDEDFKIILQSRIVTVWTSANVYIVWPLPDNN